MAKNTKKSIFSVLGVDRDLGFSQGPQTRYRGDFNPIVLQILNTTLAFIPPKNPPTIISADFA